jgi:hypothetical protein
MKTALLLLLALSGLTGCGPIFGHKVDFGTDYAFMDPPEMKRLSGKTFYIANDDDHRLLVELKQELNTYRRSPTPTLFLQREAMFGIHQITKRYNDGILGFIYPWKSGE